MQSCHIVLDRVRLENPADARRLPDNPVAMDLSTFQIPKKVEVEASCDV